MTEAVECICKLAECSPLHADKFVAANSIWNQLSGLLIFKQTPSACKEVIMSTASVLLQASKEPPTKTNAGKKLLHPAFEILCSEMEPIACRSAAAELVNLLVAQNKPNCRLLAKYTDWTLVVEMMERCSDFLLQAVIFEFSYRLAHNMAQTQAFIKALAPKHANCINLLEAEPDHFRDKTRTFLNNLNANLGEHQRVFSMKTMDTRQWIDFCVVDMAIQPANETDLALIIAYDSIRNFRLSDCQLTIWQDNDVSDQLSFVFAESDAAKLNDRVCGQIRAIMASAGSKKTSIAVLPITLAAPPSSNQDDSPAAAIAAAPEEEVRQATPPMPSLSSSSSPVHIAQKQQQHHHQQQQQEHKLPAVTPATSFATPFRKQPSQIQPMTPSRAAASAGLTPTPLVASFLQFGAALEDQLEQERVKWQQNSETMLTQLQHGFEKLAKKQTRELVKRKAEDDRATREAAKEELMKAKKTCTDALAAVNKALEKIAAMSQSSSLDDNNLADNQKAERDAYFRTFISKLNEE